MKDYFFIFGLHPSLSVAELTGYLINNKIKYQIKFSGQDFMVVSLDYELKGINKRLGGVIKYGQMLAEFNSLPAVIDLKKILLSYLKADKKFYCGFSYYPKTHAKSKRQDLFRLGLSLKSELKAGGQKVRLVSSKEVNLSSVVVSKNKLLTNAGAEVVILKTDNKLLVGRTVAVQDFAGLSFRDYSRPSRDDRSGMLPPKLAQMMINIGGNKDNILLDPFCGSGTILQEALLLGFSKVIGFDQSVKAVKDTKQNLDWLRDKYDINLDQVEVGKVDVRQLSKILSGRQIDIIVTEPDLGSPRLSKSNSNSEKKRLEKLYTTAFQEFYKVLRPGGRVVMVWPIWFGEIYLDLIKEITGQGFNKVGVLGRELENIYFLNKRGNLEYSRSRQRVTREIILWQRS